MDSLLAWIQTQVQTGTRNSRIMAMVKPTLAAVGVTPSKGALAAGSMWGAAEGCCEAGASDSRVSSQRGLHVYTNKASA
jgi:hypothetical protein